MTSNGIRGASLCEEGVGSDFSSFTGRATALTGVSSSCLFRRVWGVCGKADLSRGVALIACFESRV